MKTLTITEAKKNLGKWLSAAARGEEVAIISGATIVALRPVEVRAVPPLEIRELNYEYAAKEYGATKEEFEAFQKRMVTDLERDRRAGRLITIENPTREKIEKAISNQAGAPEAARRTPRKRANRRLARAA